MTIRSIPIRRIRICALLLLALAPTACSAQPAPNRSRLVGIVVANTQLNFSQQMAAGFRYGVGQVGGVQAVVAGPDIVDGPQEARLFDDLASRATGGVSVFALTPTLLIDSMHAAQRRGVPLIVLDNPFPPSAGFGLYIGNDNYELGRMLADLVADRLPAGARGMVVLGSTQMGAEVLDHRADGIRAELNRRLPGVTVLGPFDTQQEIAANLQSWRILVRANPHALAFLGTGDADAWHLGQLHAQAHGSWLAGGFDLDPRSLRAVQAGDLLLISPEHSLKGAIAGRLQAERARGGALLPTGWIEISGLAVTPRNVDAVISRQSSAAVTGDWFGPQITEILTHLSEHLRPLSSAR